MNVKKCLKQYGIPVLFIALLVFIDQFTKYMITSGFELYESRPVIPGVFHVTYIRNEGMAWGLFQGWRFAFLIITIPVIILFAYFFVNIRNETDTKFRVLRILILFIISGAIGNMIDRIRLAYVVDFLDFTLIKFPIFNVADIYVTCCMITFFVICLFFLKDEDFNTLIKFPKEKRQEK